MTLGRGFAILTAACFLLALFVAPWIIWIPAGAFMLATWAVTSRS